VIGVSVAAGVLLLAMEAALVFKLWLATRRYTVQLAAAESAAAADPAGGPATAEAEITPKLTPIQR
jgi:hypothetical protein